MLISDGFQQQPLELPLGWSSNSTLRSILKRQFSNDEFKMLSIEFEQFERKLIEIRRIIGDGDEIEASLQQYDHFGKRVDILRTSEAWRFLKKFAFVSGMISEPFERRFGERSRTTSFIRGFLFSPDGRYVGCPGSMTDGAIRLLELVGTDKMKSEIIPRLMSRDPSLGWTAGQWMTERPGGSDVSKTETKATLIEGNIYSLDGFKWFSSATDGDIALALAQTDQGLSLFLIKLRDEEAKLGTNGLNGIRIHRLKQKIGTKSLPTAELELKDCRAELIGSKGQGVKIVSTILNITRLHSAISSVSQLRRALDIAVAFAKVRHVGGKKGTMLSLNSMHTSNLAKLEVTCRALTYLTFGVGALLGRNENVPIEEQSEQEIHLLRLLTPVVKTFAAAITTESIPLCMNALGGQGYMRENGLGRLMNDQVVENTWEGTPSTLALDVVRVIIKSKGAAISAFIDFANSILASTPTSFKLNSTQIFIQDGLRILSQATRTYLTGNPSDADPRLALPLLFLLGYLSSTLYLLDHTIWSERGDPKQLASNIATVERWTDIGVFSDSIKIIVKILGEGKAQVRKNIAMDSALVYGIEQNEDTIFIRSVL